MGQLLFAPRIKRDDLPRIRQYDHARAAREAAAVRAMSGQTRPSSAFYRDDADAILDACDALFAAFSAPVSTTYGTARDAARPSYRWCPIERGFVVVYAIRGADLEILHVYHELELTQF